MDKIKYLPCTQDAWTEAIKKSKKKKQYSAAPPTKKQRMKCEMDKVREADKKRAASKFKIG